MALLAKTNKNDRNNRKKHPNTFLRNIISPDTFRDRYTKTPSKKKFNIILSRPNTNWSFLFLNIKILTSEIAADAKNIPKLTNDLIA